MLSNPVRLVPTADNTLNILQITDLHLSTYGVITDHAVSNPFLIKDPYACQRSFEAVLKQALNEEIRCDLILVTGDLVNKVQPAIYDHIFAVLSATEIPFACIAGNHDVTDELNSELPFAKRELLAQPKDARLLGRHAIQTDYWQLLLIDSSVAGKISGEISHTDIDWLEAQLVGCDKPAMIAVHHHVLPMDSAWIDAHMAENTAAFWQRMRAFDHLLLITSGHTHQQKTRYHQGVTVYSTPSTCYQFMPYKDNFAYDKDALPGYRWLQLGNNGKVASWIKRLDT